MSEFKRVSLGYEVRRLNADYVGGFPSEDRRPLGIVVERFPYPIPVTPRDGSEQAVEEWHRERSIAEGTPAQIAVYWQDTKVVERLLETDVIPNYPGDQGVYRAYDREFPMFAVESGGYGDVTVLLPNGEVAAYVYGPDLPGYNELENDPERQFKWLVRQGVEQYLAVGTTKPEDAEEPVETALMEQFENAEYEAA